jgi:hypothetical protein
MFFRYFKEGSAPPIRVLEINAQNYSSDKYTETTFQEWWDTGLTDDTKELWLTDAFEGEFWSEVPDPDTGQVVQISCSIETGEPIEEEIVMEESDVSSAEEEIETPNNTLE